jgi:hypothetical protein
MKEYTTISVRNIPTDLWQALKVAAVTRGMSVSEILVQAIKQYLAPKGQKP